MPSKQKPAYVRPRPSVQEAEDRGLLERLDRLALPGLGALMLVLAACHTVYALQSAMAPSSDEAHYMTGVLSIGRAIRTLSPMAVIQSYRLALGFKPPMICLPAALLYALVGDAILASKLSLILIFFAIGFAAYSLFRNLYRPIFAAFAAAILITSPIVTGLTHRFYVEGLLVLVLMVYSDLLVRRRLGRLRNAAALGVVAGIGLLTKALFPPLVLLPTLFTAYLSHRDGVQTGFGRVRSAARVAGRLAALGAIALAIAWTWYGVDSHLRQVMAIAEGNAYCAGCANPAVRMFLANGSSSPYIFTFALALGALVWLGPRLFSPEAPIQEKHAWLVILLVGLFIPTVNAMGASKAVRYLVTIAPPVAALVVFGAQEWFRKAGRAVGFLGAVTACSTVLVFHNSFDILPFAHLRVGDVRLLDSRYPLNPPDWFDDNSPLDRRDFRVEEAAALIARDARQRHPPGVLSQAGLLVHGLLINHDYLDLLADIRRQPVFYKPFYLTAISGETSPEYLLTCIGCGEVYPGRHWYNPFPDFAAQTRAGLTQYEQIFQLDAPAGCRLFGFRKKTVLQQPVTLNGMKLLAGAPSSYIDRVDTIGRSASGALKVGRQWPLHITGWAVDSPYGKPAGGVYIDIDGEAFQAGYGISRPDVAAALRNPQYDASGFDAEIFIGKIAPGTHSLVVLVLNADKSGYYRGRAIEISIE
jgi:hypothetical protein